MNRIKFFSALSLIIIGSFFFSNIVFSQQKVAARNANTAEFGNHPQLKNQLKHWEVYEIDAKQLYESANELLFDVSFDFDGKHQFATKLYPNNIRKGSYHVITQSKKGREKKKGSQVKTFSGYISKGDAGSVSLTVDEDFIYGYFQAEGTTWYIEPLWYYIPGQPKNLFVLYDERDAINDGKSTCAAVETSKKAEELVPQSKSEIALRAGECYEIELAIASDYSMFQKYGSVVDVENHNIGVMNNVTTNYVDQFNWDINFFIIAPQYIVSAPGTDPWTASTDVDDLINSFSQWGRDGGFGYALDLGQLWSNRDFDGSTVGYAWVGVLCGFSKYHILQDYTANANSLRVLTAHEIGHNLDASHDAGGSGFIMAPSINNTNAWSVASKNSINTHLQSRIDAGCITACPVTAPPVADFTSSEIGNICIGSSVTFTDNSTQNPTSWLWSFPGGTPNTSTDENPTIRYSALGTYNVSLTATNDQGNNSITKNNLIIVNAFPVANAGIDMQLSCVTTSVVLDGTASEGGANISYQWTTAGGNIVANGATNQPTVDAIGTYTITVTNTVTGCEESSNVVVTNDVTLPTADAGTDVTILCTTGASINIGGNGTTAGATIIYSWTTPDGNIVSGANAANAAVDAEGTYTLTVTNTATSCASTDIVIVSEDVVLPSVNAGVDETISCANAQIMLGVDTGAGVNITFLWTTADGNIVSGENTVNAIVNAIGTYTVTATNSVSGCVNSDQVIVTGSATPPTAEAGADKSIDCNNSTAVIGGNSSVGANITYVWSTNDGNIVSGANIIQATVDQPGTYLLLVTDTENSCTDESQVIVSGDLTPPNADAGADLDLTCAVPTASLGGNSANGANISYAWTTADGNIVSGINLSTVTVNAIGTYTITVENTATGCTSTDQVVVGGNDAPPVADAGEEKQIDCNNLTATIGGNSTTGGNITYLWTTAEGNIVSGASEAQADIDAGGTYSIAVTNTTSGCTSSSEVVVLEDKELPTVNAGEDIIINEGESITLNGLGNGTLFLWSPISGLDDPNIATPSASPDASTTYTLTVTADNGCSAMDEVTVAVLEKIVNSFSPNGDGLNETWNISGLEHFSDSRVTIFNRQGRKVFDSAENGKVSWDGTFNGKVLPTGTYFYIIRLGKDGEEVKGNVNIIK